MERAAVVLAEPVARVVEVGLDLREAVVVDPEGEVVDRARSGALVVGRLPFLVDEERDQTAVAAVEKQVCHLRAVEVRLAEHERHPQHVPVEPDRLLRVRPDQGDVVRPGRL
jgi:hypothetical protein